MPSVLIVNVSCEDCGFNAMDSEALKIHKEMHIKLKCDKCNFKASDFKELRALIIQYLFNDSTGILLVFTQKHASLGSHDQLTV